MRPTHPNIVHPHRSTTIDYCLCSLTVMEHITYASSTPYDLDTLGDHRGFILDINIRHLLGFSYDKISHSPRKLVLLNPTAVEKYLKMVHDKFTKQNIFKRAETLYRRVQAGNTDIGNIMNKYEKLDTEVYGICKKAEDKCRPAIAGRYE